MPIKKAVVKSDADAVAPRKRTSVAKSPAVAAETAPVSGETKARSSSKKAVTHRHKKQQQQEPAISSPAPEVVSVSAVVPPTVPEHAVPAYEPSGEEIAKLAYSYYVARGYQPGDPASDWFRAVHELKARHAAASALLED